MRKRARAQAQDAAQPQPAGKLHPPLSDHDILQDLVHQTTLNARQSAQDGRRQESSVLSQTVPPSRSGAAAGQGTPAGAATGQAQPANTFIRREQVQEQGQPGQMPGTVRTGTAGSGAGQPEQAGQETAQETADRESFFGPPSLIRTICARLRCLGLVCAGVLVFFLSLFAVYRLSIWLYHWIHTSPMFITRHIDISGNVRLNRDMILHLGGLHEGVNAFSVSVAGVERRLRATPWVEDVSVQRVLPDRFVIRVQERMPSFWIRRENRLYYANDRGEIIAPVESSNFMSLPILSIEPGCEEAIPYLARLMKDLRSGILPVEAGAIATVDVTPSRGVELYLEDREMRLSLAPDDWEGNLRRLGVTIGDLARRRELSSVQEVRAAQGSVWVVLRRTTQ